MGPSSSLRFRSHSCQPRAFQARLCPVPPNLATTRASPQLGTVAGSRRISIRAEHSHVRARARTRPQSEHEPAVAPPDFGLASLGGEPTNPVDPAAGAFPPALVGSVPPDSRKDRSIAAAHGYFSKSGPPAAAEPGRSGRDDGGADSSEL